MTRDKLEKLRTVLTARRILTIEEINKILNVTSRMSSHRYLKRLDYLTSYSHGGKYYALRESAKFDEFGFWHCGDVGFSKYGTLLATIARLISDSEGGKTNDELANQCKLRVQNALLQLVKEKKISREKVGNIYLYTEKTSVRRAQQQINRKALSKEISISDWIIIEVLVEIIRSSREVVDIATIACNLRKRHSSISLDQVQQVFYLHDLEKKTPDFTP